MPIKRWITECINYVMYTMSATVTMMAPYSLLLVGCALIITVHGGDYCFDDKGCPDPMMRCFKDYEMCNAGTCGCIYGVNDNAVCAEKREGDTCTSHNQCPRGLDCSSGRCKCSGKLTPDGVHCLKADEVLLGDYCDADVTCLHKTEDGDDYVSGDVICKRDCLCRLGLRQSGPTCRRIQPDERGCLTSSDCSGDSLCKHMYCKCPTGYKIVTYEPKKCGRNNAMTHLAEGETCDEILSKNRFCASGLQCVSCGPQIGFKCRKYKSSRPNAVLSGCTLNYPRIVIVLPFVTLLSRLLWY